MEGGEEGEEEGEEEQLIRRARLIRTHVEAPSRDCPRTAWVTVVTGMCECFKDDWFSVLLVLLSQQPSQSLPVQQSAVWKL